MGALLTILQIGWQMIIRAAPIVDATREVISITRDMIEKQDQRDTLRKLRSALKAHKDDAATIAAIDTVRCQAQTCKRR